MGAGRMSQAVARDARWSESSSAILRGIGAENSPIAEGAEPRRALFITWALAQAPSPS